MAASQAVVQKVLAASQVEPMEADSSRPLARSTARPGNRPRSDTSSRRHNSRRQSPNPTSCRQSDTGMGMTAAATAAAAAAASTCNLGTPCRASSMLRTTVGTSSAVASGVAATAAAAAIAVVLGGS